MNLTDAEILELNTLCSSLVDGTITATERERLGHWLRESPQAREIYVRWMGQSASLHHYAAERQADAVDRKPGTLIHVSFLRWAAGIAAVFAVAGGAWYLKLAPRPATPAFVAQLTASRDCEWVGTGLASGARVAKGQHLELTRGAAEITFDSGARILLEAPAALDVNSAWDGTLRRGKLRAVVPHEAIGFRISNPSVEVVDLGTEFSMVADPAGTAEVLVTKGEVEAAPRTAGDSDSILLKETESRKFATTGVSAVDDPKALYADAMTPVPLDRFTPSTQVAHWTFSEPAGDHFQAQAWGVATDRSLDFILDEKASSAAAHGGPLERRGIHFDGQLYAKGLFPGISGPGTKTLAFWVRVPVDAQLSDSFAMVGWNSTLKKLNYRPVHIGWNRSPNEGTLGALRTDFGGGSAIGTTSLKDGRWHHVAVVFAAGQDDTAAVQVKQYLDGHLESDAIAPGTVRAPHGDPKQIESQKDVLWMGCRIGLTQPRRDRFRGDIADMFVADRGLEPQEIVSIMTAKRLPEQTFLAMR